MAAPNINSSFSLSTFILGAGRSRRMGRPKLLLPWAGTTIVAHLVRSWRLAGAERACVVYAEGDEALCGELDRLSLPAANRIPNRAPERGMFSSIQCAARWFADTRGATHCAIVLGDQPHLRVATLQGLVQFSAQNPRQVCQPFYRNRARHPVILPAPLFTQLAVSKAGTLKEALTGWESYRYESDDAGLDLDIDTPDDYTKALLWQALDDAPGQAS